MAGRLVTFANPTDRDRGRFLQLEGDTERTYKPGRHGVLSGGAVVHPQRQEGRART